MTLPDEDEIMAEDLAQAVGLSEAKTRYFLDRLCEQELVYRLEYSGRPPGYVRRDKGRKYLFEAGLLK
jgi:predicted ArsR family transcriptional regulator